MVAMKICLDAYEKLSAAIEHSVFRHRLLAMPFLLSALPAHAIPPPPSKPALLREARMAVTVQLIEASKGRVTRITKLCQVRGKIPVYSDQGRAASFYAREITGCTMPMNGKALKVSVRGAKAVSKDRVTYATATVSVTPPDAVPLCSMCGLQPLADSRSEIRVSGKPKSMTFNLSPNPGSILNAKPTVWLDAEVEIRD
ncbi:hypothetical protein [Massilia sp. IC2-476]|uniref:hypothetical protein n=1 Tax=Massilia sp. IC2-476 TaxID=2887199 RepID=UPI001D10E13B|nr:hypothetical protein [Massilia sp. IC2-476]MCC2972578.1 hypothetical protein [Massilia sp. IC2-476]